MNSLKERLDREVEGLPILELAKTIACARRRSRNQRIAAGVVGIAVFVAAVWIVTSGLSLDHAARSRWLLEGTSPDRRRPDRR